MKIKKFIGQNVHGYLNFDITFDLSLNFLIGINGTGKTTVLNLIDGMLNLNLKPLVMAAFDSIKLICLTRSQQIIWLK